MDGSWSWNGDRIAMPLLYKTPAWTIHSEMRPPGPSITRSPPMVPDWRQAVKVRKRTYRSDVQRRLCSFAPRLTRQIVKH
eukprot:scaffold128_cov328-Pavlova_lutheri.AAC.3